jgi:hypothetical protein
MTSIPRSGVAVLFLIGPAFDCPMERSQHPFHFPQLFLKSPCLVGVEDVKRASALEVIVHLVSGCECDLQESGELALTPLAGTFRDVVGDCVDGSEELGTETWCGPSDRPPEGRTVARDRKVRGPFARP